MDRSENNRNNIDRKEGAATNLWNRALQNSQATFWLVLWTVTNVGITILNKFAFEIVHFPYPYMLTAIHMLACTVFTQSVFCHIQSDPQKSNVWIQLLGDELLHLKVLNQTDQHKIWLFSVVYSLNIGVGNLSLRHVSVNFNQVMRSLVPVITLWISIYLGKIISYRRRRAVWPVVIGVAMATYGDRLNCNLIGLLSTTFCVLFASLKVIISSEFMTGNLKLHPVELLYYMAPASFLQCLLLSLLNGEVKNIAGHWQDELSPQTDIKPVVVILISSLLAVSLNISALQAYKLTSPLTVCIAGAVKQVLMVVLGTILFSVHVTLLNGLGIITVMVGSFLYGYISIGESELKDQSGEDEETGTLLGNTSKN